MKGKRVLLIGIPIIVFLLWITGSVNLWFYSIRDIAGNVEVYYLEHDTINSEYSVSIDLSDPKSNEGKVLYDDGENQIYISDVIVRNEKEHLVHFRTSGNYNLYGASLVTATKHSRVENGWFTSNFEANAFATYRGYTFKVYESGTSGLNYKEGDDFGLYLIPHDTGVTIDIAEDPIIDVTLSNLTMHKWGRN